MEIKIAYGKGFKSINILEEKIIDVLNPNKGKAIKNRYIREEVELVLEEPTDMLPLINLVNKNSKIVIIVDDNTRPTPTKKILDPILKTIKKKNISNKNITIIVAVGMHKKLNREGLIGILGKDIYDNYNIENHDALNKKNLIDLGETSFGTPVLINKKVYEADLRILTGIIKPHNIAGYTGGGKSILPGVCGLDTILSNHSFKATLNPCSCLGVIEGNPMRRDMEEALKLIGTSFMINVVLNYKEEVVKVVAGDVIKAHRKGVEFQDKLSKLDVAKQAEICICGTPAPIDINFYQMLNSISAPYRIKKPIIKSGGTIIVVGSSREGISDGDFYNVLKSVPRELVWERIKSKEFIYKERPALHIYLEGEREYNLVVVSEERNRQLFRDMHINFFSSLQNAVDSIIDKYQNNKNVIILPHAPYIIPHLVE